MAKKVIVTQEANRMLGAVRSQITNLVEQYCAEPNHRDAVLRALASSGLALHPEGPCRGGLLTLLVNQAIRGSPDDVAVEAAAGVELQMAAASMFDHVADEETDPKVGFSAAEEIALAIAVLMCGTAAASHAVHRASESGSALPALLRSYSNVIGACGGQFLDAHLKKRDWVTTDEALVMTTLKAGSLGRFAAELGAVTATEDAETVAGFGEFGFNLLTYVQLIDDLKDACPADGRKGDLWHFQKTVPLVFFYDYLARQRLSLGNGTMLQQTWEKNIPRLRQEFQASGAGLFCAVTAESFLNRAKDHLEHLRPRLETVDHLEQLVESLEVNPQDLFPAS